MSNPTSKSYRPVCHDLVPWADPYIAALMEKLRRSERRWHLLCEAPPPLGPESGDVNVPYSDPWSRRGAWPD
jgi:hypothetical protein